MGIFLGLVHHPVLNRHGEVSSTAVTNVDLHDLGRAGRTYGVNRFFVVTPIDLQRELVGRVIRHWADGPGSKSPSRQQAFDRIEVAASIDQAVERVSEITGEKPLIAVTGASLVDDTTPFSEVTAMIRNSGSPILLLFGTGWGLAPEVIERANIRLPAISGPEGPLGYNHLSVRAAAVIVLDRLLGE